NLTPADQVLVIGCGTGYSAAVLAHMGTTVVALEEDLDLARRAQSALAARAGQVTVVTGPLVAGWPAAAPYDLVLLDGAIEVAPEALGRQLKHSGRLA